MWPSDLGKCFALLGRRAVCWDCACCRHGRAAESDTKRSPASPPMRPRGLMQGRPGPAGPAVSQAMSGDGEGPFPRRTPGSSLTPMRPTHRRTRRRRTHRETRRRSTHRGTRRRSIRRRAPPSATRGVRGGRARWSIPETVRFPVHRECRVRSGAAMVSAAVVSSSVAQPPGATFTAQARRHVGISSRAERAPAPLNARAVFRVRRCRADPRLRAPSTVRPRARAGALCCVLHRHVT